ncbi:MAG: BamA/TamA family outer membrane protein [candidate division Zixibacteria bacterium]|nr:BamA/TamA family outer membrane protein [candidate division Zixibacteria bacterium]
MMRKLVLFFILAASSALAQSDTRDERLWLRWMRDKPAISAITVEGNQYFSDSEIKKRMYSRTRSLWGTLKGDRRTRLQRESIGRDTLEIKYLYFTNGYLGVQVEESVDRDPVDSSAHLKVGISEGRRCFYGVKSFSGEYDRDLHVGLYKIGERLKPGKPINLFELRRAAYDMKTIFANNGYPYAKVDFVLDSSSSDGSYPVLFQIDGDELVTFGAVTPVGTKRYPAYTVRRESRIKPGALYRRRDIIDTRIRLLEAGYFSTASIVMSENSTDSLKPEMELRVRERKPMFFTFKTGAGQSHIRDIEWDVSSTFGGRNLFGSRHYDLSAGLKFGVDNGVNLLEHVYRVRLTEPWLLGTRMPLTLSAVWEPGVKDPEQNYRIESWSLAMSSIKKFTRETRASAGIEYESVRIFGVPDNEVQFLKDEQGIVVRRNIYLALRRDSRDHIFIPRRGSLTDVRAEFYGGFLGGDNHFTKLEASWSSFQVVWPGWISATRIKSGWTQQFSPSKEVPIIDRFYLGGANSIRGFKVNSLGPTLADGTLEKANFIALFNQEFRWHTFQLFQFIPGLKGWLGAWPLWQSIFFDMGNGYRKPEEISWRSLAYSYGTGIQIVSPAGPIRVDYARRIKTRTIDFDYRWHFSILYAF